jgi:hypothetical protein
MATFELDGSDDSVCPLLGLDADHRSHFTYPHPDHRCFAAKRPATADAHRQSTYCLTDKFTVCDRYLARQSTIKSSARAGSEQTGPSGSRTAAKGRD